MFLLHRNLTQTDIWKVKMDGEFFLKTGGYSKRESIPNGIEGVIFAVEHK